MAALLDVDQLADRGGEYAGEVGLDDLERVAAAPGAVARVALRFARDRVGRATARGYVEATLQAECQRCLETMALALRCEVDVVFVRPGQDPTGDLDARDWVELERKALNVAAFVEEELLLASPPVPRHADDSCAAHEGQVGRPL